MLEADESDAIPEDSTPRLKVGRALEPAGSGRCMECPRHAARQAWCPVRAEPRAGRAPMCRYGRALVAVRQGLGEGKTRAIKEKT